MFKTAFSTVACPEWLLADVARSAAEWGYDGVELRTFGYGSTEFACDPALTAAEKVRAIFSEAGVQQAVLASGVAFDELVRPAVLGWALDTERTVRAAKGVIDLATQIECRMVRVFGFELQGREKRSAGVRRIAARIGLALDAARNTGVRLVLENGGSFSTAVQLIELVDAVANPALGVEYSAAVAAAAGEVPRDGARLLGDRMWVAKVKDYAADGRPVPIGDGVVGLPGFVHELHARHFAGWVVVEWDRAWIRSLARPQAVLPEAVRRLYSWAAEGRARGGMTAATVSMR
jgi:sugar phosphate isomerase/epimerase